MRYIPTRIPTPLTMFIDISHFLPETELHKLSHFHTLRQLYCRPWGGMVLLNQ